jgi:hypothetical protein
MRQAVLRFSVTAAFVCVTVATQSAEADEFVMPFTGDLYLQQMGGSAGGVTTFGLGTSPSNFVPYYTGLPNNPSPTGEVFVGLFNGGTTIHFGEFTTFAGQSGYAFSNDTDQASIIAFSDVDNSLGMGGSIIQRTGPNTWLLHLDDALSYLYDDDDNDVLMQVRVIPEPATWALFIASCVALICRRLLVSRLLRTRAHDHSADTVA